MLKTNHVHIEKNNITQFLCQYELEAVLAKTHPRTLHTEKNIWQYKNLLKIFNELGSFMFT